MADVDRRLICLLDPARCHGLPRCIYVGYGRYLFVDIVPRAPTDLWITSRTILGVVLALSATLSHGFFVSPSCSLMAVTMPVSSPAGRVDRSNECWSDMKSLIWEFKPRHVA